MGCREGSILCCNSEMKYAISVVIPVYNSEDNLEELMKQIAAALKKKKYQVVLVNDRSRDRSWQVMIALKKKYTSLTAVNLRKNSGQDNAIMAGLRHAEGDVIIIMDDDLQHSPLDIPILVETLEKEGADVCYANFKQRKQAVWKNIGSWFNGKIAEIAIDKPRGVYLSSFKAIRGEVIQEVILYRGSFPYLDGLLFMVTDNFTEVSIEHHKRFSGSSNYNLVRSVSVFLKLLTSFSIIPLRIASYVGFLVTLAGAGLGIYFFVEFLVTDNSIMGWTSLVLLLIIFSGIMLISLGLLGEYLGRMYLNLNHKPQYIIKEVFK